jgi:hypothetical protein
MYKRRHSSTPRLPLSQVSPDQLLRAFDDDVDSLFFCEEEEELLNQPVQIGRDFHPLDEILRGIQAWGNCHGVQVNTDRCAANVRDDCLSDRSLGERRGRVCRAIG